MSESDTANAVRVVRREVPKTKHALHANSVLHRVLAARGVLDKSELNFSLSELPRPDQLPDIEKGCARLIEAHKAHERILIVGDYDCDGATSTALMVRVLKAMDFEAVDYVIPDRKLHGYGLSQAVIDVGIERHKPSLIITVDNGVSAHEAIDYAASINIDVVVTDHHLPADTLPKAIAVVNPSRADSEFPSTHIAGVGVAFYFLVALRKALLDAGCLARNVRMADWLDLVAIGTVADVVPLDSVNRILVEQGLRRIRAGSSVPGVTSLVKAAKKELKSLSSIDIGMVIGPRLNAAGRIDDMGVGVQCLLADDVSEAALLANSLQGLNDRRRDIQADMQENAERIVGEIQASSDTFDNFRFAYVVHQPDWHQGVIGIVAGRLKDQLFLPVVVFASDEEGLLKGSARSIPGVNIRDMFVRVNQALPGAIERFGGHAMAAGLTLRSDALKDFTAELNRSVAQALNHDIPVRQFETDGELSVHEFSPAIARLLSHAAPWGTRFESPLFDNYFIVESSRLVGNQRHAQLNLRPIHAASGDVGAPIGAISFGDTRTFSAGTEVHGVYELSLNLYKNRESVQMILRHLAPR